MVSPEIARVPAPAFHVGDDEIDLPVLNRGVERLDCARIEAASFRQFVRLLELSHRRRERSIVGEVGGFPGKSQLLAQEGHARILCRSFRVELEQGPVTDLDSRATRLRTHLGKLRPDLLTCGGANSSRALRALLASTSRARMAAGSVGVCGSWMLWLRRA